MSAAGTARCVVAACGLAIEARIARGAGVRAMTGGNDRERLAMRLERAIADGAVAIASFGIAGGLAHDARRGACIIGRAVVTKDGARVASDAAWLARLVERLPHARVGDVAAGEGIVGDAASKRALHARTHAVAVDTESDVVARVAAAHGVPFVVLRVVCDAATRSLPAAAVAAFGPRGVDAHAIARSIVRKPSDLAPLATTAIDAAIALRALRRARRDAGAGLGYPNFGELLLDVA